MKKILVTTDFSTHSKAGLRFAVQLAAQADLELVFFHCFQALIPTTIHRQRIENTMQEQAAENLKKLEKFVAGVHKGMKIAPGKYRCVVMENLNPESAILDYAREHGVDFICIGTRGAGTLRKIIGTHTGNVMRKSPVPVLAVPHTYRVRPVKKLLYATDLESLDKEMSAVSAFAQTLDVRVDMAHFYYPGELKVDRADLAGMWRQKYKRLDGVFIEPFDSKAGFAAQLDALIQKTKPSIAVFFTHTNKTWFDKMFSTSRSQAFSFVTKVPMLVYRKF